MPIQRSLWQELEMEDWQQGRALSLADAEVSWYPQAFTLEESDQFLAKLLDEIAWKQESITLFKRKVLLPRLTAWYGDRGKIYTYSNLTMEPEPWTPALLKIRSRVEEIARTTFNSVLLNLYRDGRDSIAWHSDDELELGKNPIIGSVSFGGTRRFILRHRFHKPWKGAIDLTHGSFLLMRGPTQHFWQHQVPKTRKPVQPRINLTFRQILSGSDLRPEPGKDFTGG
ncbi:MAG: alpha-ketoglutarate-dependent dioxygenase AlkB [Leptolyngbyaceae cyanobacterium HOT.MB2.61]|jgi:alkylated DNA repair dioxygenase AlkB|nr:alpha-ketoglutarate-dependent dioxygenase AlkB [Leptolyngbyaceae cyanobacterium HOT.MB2.61]